MALTYHRFLEVIIELYSDGKLKEALAYIDENREKVNGIDSQIDNFAFCIAAVAGDKELALDIFEKSIREKGFWYETSQLEEDSDLDIMREDVRFKALLEMNRRREHESLGLGQATVHVREGNKEHGYIILHGNHENARITKGAWSEKAVNGDLCAFLQSGQPDFHDAYHWNDRDKAISDATQLIKDLTHKYEDVASWTLVGFSMSATVALDIVTRDLFKPDHLILFGPWLPNLKNEKATLAGLYKTKISILIGERDRDCKAHAELLVKYLADHGIQANFEVMKDTGHSFPEALELYLNKL